MVAGSLGTLHVYFARLAKKEFTDRRVNAKVRLMRLARFNSLTGKMELFSPTAGHVERFLDDDSAVDMRLSAKKGDTEEADPDEGTFSIRAYSGKAVERWWGKMVLNLAGMSREKQTTQLLEHMDMRPVGVSTRHEIDEKLGLMLYGHMLDDESCPDAAMLRKQCGKQKHGRPGLKLKSSIGSRFEKYRFLAKDEEAMINGRKFKFSEEYDTLVVDEWHLFENSFIYVNPADLATSATIMHNNSGAPPMSQKVNDSATGAVLAGNLAVAATTPPPSNTPAGATIVQFADLTPEGKKAALTEAKAEIERETLAFAKAFPDKPEFAAKMRTEGKTVDQAKLIAWDDSEAARLKAESEKKDRTEVLAGFSQTHGRDGQGFNPDTAERRLAATDFQDGPRSIYVRQAEGMLHRYRGAVAVFGHEALSVMIGALSGEARRIKLQGGGDGPQMPESSIRAAAEALIQNMPSHARADLERLAGAGGHSAMDLGQITVKGFLDSFHNSMEAESTWGNEIMYRLESNQESEVVKWLGYHPQLQPFDAKAEEQTVPVYALPFTNIWFDVTIPLDVLDFHLQKFGKINQLMGQQGAVIARHWNLLAAQQLEQNKTCYTKVNLFSNAHVLGGKAPALQTNDLSAANGQGFCAIPDLNNITPSQANALLMNAVPYLGAWIAANGDPMNEEENYKILVLSPRKWGKVFRSAVFSDRLDGSPNGAGGSRDNPIKVTSQKTGETWDVKDTTRLSTPGGTYAANNFIYIAMLGNDRKPLVSAEPVGLTTFFDGPGSESHRKTNKYRMWGRVFRCAAPGAPSSIIRVKLGA